MAQVDKKEYFRYFYLKEKMAVSRRNLKERKLCLREYSNAETQNNYPKT
jgi:hypothetical protein